MKSKFKYLIVLLLAVVQEAWAYDVRIANNGDTTKVAAVMQQNGATYTIGNSYNAAFSEYTQGTLIIPRITTADSDKNVIGRYAFRLCSGITKIVIEEGIDSIGSYAFLGCGGVKSIELPASLKSVARGAFVGLAHLESIKCNGSIAPTWATADVFDYAGTVANLTPDAKKRILYVPDGALESYNTTKCNNIGWQEAFNRIVEVDMSSAKADVEIATAQDLLDFANAINNNIPYKGKQCASAHLTADIDMKGKTWTPIGNSANPFTGLFNGNGHVIKNLTYDKTSADAVEVGLFGRIEKATIFRLHLLDPKFRAYDKVGCVAGYCQDNCKIYDVLVQSAATDYTATVTCMDGTDVYLGGLIGYAEKNCVIESCMFDGILVGTDAGGTHIGGIAGYTSVATIKNCYTANTLTDKKSGVYMGGIVGTASGSHIDYCLVRNTINYTAQEGQKKLAGLIIGTHGDKNVIKNNACYQPGSFAITSEGTNAKDGVNELVDNQTWATQGEMTQEATMSVLHEADWYYFTGDYIDWPIPSTLATMYTKDLETTDADGIVYFPIGAEKDQRTNKLSPLAYMVVDYAGSAESVTIPQTFNDKSVTKIAHDAFFKNTTLKDIKAPSITHIGDRAFFGSTVKSADFQNLQRIGGSAFEECDSLTAFRMYNQVDSVGNCAFANCVNLTSFIIGKGLKKHAGNFLANCDELTSITVDGENPNGYFCHDNVLMKNGVTASYVIAYASGKTGDYTIPVDQLTKTDVTIEDECFAYCSYLNSIVFPAGKTYQLGANLFSNSDNLSYIDFTKAAFKSNATYTVDRLNEKSNPFYQLSQNTLVYLPKGHGSKDYEPNIVIMNDDQTAATANFLMLDDDNDFKPMVPITAEKGVYFSRDIEYWYETEEGGVYPQGFTSYLPYDVTLSSESTKVYSPKTIETSNGVTTVTFTEVKDKKMKAYTPYFLIAAGDQEVDFSVEEKITIGTKPSEQGSAMGGFIFKGTTEAIPNSGLYDAARPAYLYQADDKWHKVTQNDADAYIRPFQAYFQAEGNTEVSTISMSMAYAWDGNGTEASPYIIKTADQLKELSEAFNMFDVAVKDKYFRQAANIEFDRTVTNNYTPINEFYGYYDGAGYTISGLNLNSPGENRALFLDIMTGTVKNVILKNSYIYGAHAGAIAVSVNDASTLENCHVLKDVTIESMSDGGGVVGILNGGKATVTGCTSQAVMKGNEVIGGIIGTAYAGTVSNCMYLGNSLTSSTTFFDSKLNAVVGFYAAPDAVKKENLSFTCTTLADPNAALMPNKMVDNSAFLSQLAERDKFLLNNSGLTKDKIGYDITLVNRPIYADQNADGTWRSKANSICLPYSLDLAKLDNAADIKVFRLHHVDLENKVLLFTNEIQLIEAGVPCIVVIDKGSISLEAKNTTVVAAPKEPIAVYSKDGSKQMGWWTGTFMRMEKEYLMNNNIYLITQSKFFRTPTTTTNVAFGYPFIGYFSALEPLGFDRFQLKFIATQNGEETSEEVDFPADEFEDAGEWGDVTGISPIIQTIDSDGTSRYYDLNGRQLNEKPRKGLYINNGKLMMNK